MLPYERSSMLWVAPGACNGLGTFENPFGSIAEAWAKVKAGQTIVLKSGRFRENLTIEKSGAIDSPIRITCEDNGEAIIEESTWFLYDVSDIVISQITFERAPQIAISVIGKCMRNRFELLKFKNCGSSSEHACTLFFGGSGASCNMVENCLFISSESDMTSKKKTSIALMITEGDSDGGEPNTDHCFRKNAFYSYSYGILAGSRNSTRKGYGHIIEDNRFFECFENGIMVKCGDTLIRGNYLFNCSSNGISILAGNSNIIENNRIVASAVGIALNSMGHTVSNNCLVRCSKQAIHISKESHPDIAVAGNIVIENNTCIECGTTETVFNKNDVEGKATKSAIRIDAGTSCVIRKNLFFGSSRPYELEENNEIKTKGGRKSMQRHLVVDNIVCGYREEISGCRHDDISLPYKENDDFENSSGYGAAGAVLKPDFANLKESPRPLIFDLSPNDDANNTLKQTEIQIKNNEEFLHKTMFFS